MEVSHEVFGFMKIVKESIKLIPKNGKIMVLITLISLLPSLFILLLVSFHKFLTKKVDTAIEESLWSDSGYTPNQIIAFYLVPLLLAGIAFVVATARISQISLTAVILVSAISYAGEEALLPDLIATIKGKRRSSQQLKHRTPRASKSQRCCLLVVGTLTAYLGAFDPNAVTVAVAAVVVIALFTFVLYSSVEGLLAPIITVLEEGEAAVDKARELAVGHRLRGFMLNLFVTLLVFIILALGYSSTVFEDKLYHGIGIDYVAIHGLIFFNVFTPAIIFLRIAYTVLYFECKKKLAPLGRDLIF